MPKNRYEKGAQVMILNACRRWSDMVDHVTLNSCGLSLLFDAIVLYPNGCNHIQVVERQCPGDFPASFLSNLSEFPTSCFLGQLALLIFSFFSQSPQLSSEAASEAAIFA